MISILLFYFVAVCNPDAGCSGWPRVEAWGDSRYSGWTDNGPWFTIEDCQAERAMLPFRGAVEAGPEGSMAKANPWAEHGESACYAREIFLLH